MASPTKSVLVVDDEPAVASTIRQVLERGGYRVTCILDAQLAVQRIAAETFDVIITDMLMPDVDGAQLITLARRHQPQTRIIAMSGGGSFMSPPEALGFANKIGATTVLQKPFTVAELLACLERVSQSA